MAGVNKAEGRISDDRIALGDYVILTGGGMKRMVVVQKGNRLRLGSTGTVDLEKLAGLRFGEVLRYDPKRRVFIPTNDYPDLDITNLQEAVEEVRDNRHLVDDNRSQILSKDEIAAMREEKGVDELITSLAEKSTTFHTKTAYAQEKYLRKKKKRHGTLYKVERVTPDGLAEIHLPTINPSDVEPEETRWMRLRADTLALILHHSDVHSGSRVLVYDKTNGYLEAALLSRLGDEGIILQLMDKVSQPNTFPAQAMGLPRIREMWKAIPRNEGFLLGVETVEDEERAAEKNKKRNCDNGNISQWLRGIDAHNMLKEKPADSLIIVDDEGAEEALNDLLPFLALCGHVVVFSPYLEDLTALFAKLRTHCVNICISETWYRHYQLLPNRTHPTVNMSTAGGYVLTAIKVEANGGSSNSNTKTNEQVQVEKTVPQSISTEKEENGQTSRKRVREEEEGEKGKGEKEKMMAEAME
ncbi:tRNA (adenine-N(1)-)-methyltransferase non-catalytic subunit [Trypanosoma theileri]|uniref:tRNA (adenine(58)-N(1))-methyltransferase non-catalytic subunit TRM6 n=1 Tax=Trypanosoma theileri TaxID=67003 RepID=A0A1X0NLQ1_9TRYP|nr:tRNA (adenine-N(1)-)-methyltransferase non-catalytic subunit [Trypanosoma theileri]ORC85635.1 tRNA (adenine-N(1)-)-methyltransferase non-catalytic subunit [Trypanosoma theileri]